MGSISYELLSCAIELAVGLSLNRWLAVDSTFMGNHIFDLPSSYGRALDGFCLSTLCYLSNFGTLEPTTTRDNRASIASWL